MNNWQVKTLGEYLSLQRGYDLTAEQRTKGNIPVMGAGGQNGTHGVSKASGPGVIVGRSGSSYGQVYLSEGDFWPHNTSMFVTDFKGNDEYFTYYLLKNLDFDRLNSGSAQPSLNRNFIYPVKVRVPKPNEQTKISAVLRAIDQKIELNNRINAELEAMAKTLYDYWFVQFDFPDVNGKPYKASGGKMVYNDTLKREVPDGWEAVSVAQLVDIRTGKEDANFATENGEYHFFTCGEASLRCDNYVFNGQAVLLAGNGSFLVKKFEGKFNAYQRTYVLMPRDELLFAPLYFAVNNRVTALTSGSRGSIVKFITKGDIEDIYVPLPKDRDLTFSKILSKNMNESSRLYEQNLELIKLRDWLLPMLMNGQVTVKPSTEPQEAQHG
ncbi:TPA: restriction endonuclease subunit S [Vibrio cholerae]|uniref:restriction endonuclease subunit S n=1 Tax=Vibrio fluvialis TaxID=676 RepID=UPI0015586C71|nr:restriction endonuclease subunit S [Vibrio fluvialis]HCJ7266187.1 restriction endonuclease subunit S [Vibrio cholerae]